MSERYGFTVEEKSQSRERRKAEREQKKGERLEKTRARNSRHAENVRFFDLFGVVGGLLLGLALVFALSNPERELSFFGLLDFLSNAPQFDLQDLQFLGNLTQNGNWGFFNFLRDFFNMLVNGLQGVLNVGVILLNTVSYFWTFVSWVFIG